ncbi:protein of unknown function [Methylacidimicrobium sp. AP8]|nr:protein of unknown function [Methylacidimicrobium sp. AP8]
MVEEQVDLLMRPRGGDPGAAFHLEPEAPPHAADPEPEQHHGCVVLEPIPLLLLPIAFASLRNRQQAPQILSPGAAGGKLLQGDPRSLRIEPEELSVALDFGGIDLAAEQIQRIQRIGNPDIDPRRVGLHLLAPSEKPGQPIPPLPVEARDRPSDRPPEGGHRHELVAAGEVEKASRGIRLQRIEPPQDAFEVIVGDFLHRCSAFGQEVVLVEEPLQPLGGTFRLEPVCAMEQDEARGAEVQDAEHLGPNLAAGKGEEYRIGRQGAHRDPN